MALYLQYRYEDMYGIVLWFPELTGKIAVLEGSLVGRNDTMRNMIFHRIDGGKYLL
jgi:hypothetical protein